MDGKLLRSLITVILTCLSFASLVSSTVNKKTGTCCSDGLGLNYTLPMFMECKKEKHPNGSMVQKIPKLIPYSEKEAAACPRRKNRLGIKPGHRVCRFPDCASNPCVNGWCEETMENYKCHCPAGYKGRRCDKRSTTTQEASTIGSTTTVISESSTTREPSTTSSTTSKAATTLASSTEKESTTISSTDSTTSGSTTEWKCTATKCFHVYTVKLIFSEAVAYCDSLSPVTLNETIISGTRNASVLFVGSDAEITEVEDLFDFFSSSRNVWVNCFDEDSDTEFVCTADDEGTLTSIRNWRYDQPNGSGNQACVAVVTYDNKWQDRQCTDGYYTVCQIYRVPVEDIDECATNPCSNGQCVDDVAGFVCKCESGWVGKFCNYAVEWQCSPTKCYHTSPYQQNFDDALAYCSALSPVPLSASTTNDWSLLFVGSDAEINEVETLMGISSWLYIWVNCNDRKTDGEFECFMDPQTPAATTHWKSNRPNGGTRQNCVAVSTRDDKWRDKECHDLYTTICQIVIS